MTAVKRVDVFEPLYLKDSTDIDVTSLATLLGVHQQELAEAFQVTPGTASRKGIDSNNLIMKQWMRVFNLVVDLIEEAEPLLSKFDIRLKMSRFLKLPNSHFSGQSLLEVMLKGKTRKVIRFIEQLLQ